MENTEKAVVLRHRNERAYENTRNPHVVHLVSRKGLGVSRRVRCV